MLLIEQKIELNDSKTRPNFNYKGQRHSLKPLDSEDLCGEHIARESVVLQDRQSFGRSTARSFRCF